MPKRQEKLIKAVFDEDGHIIEWEEVVEPKPEPTSVDPLEELKEAMMKSLLGGSGLPSIPRLTKEPVRKSEDLEEGRTNTKGRQSGAKLPEPDYIQGFHRKLSSIMKDNKYDRTVSKFRSGKLDTDRLYKVFCNTDRVFKRKFERLNKEYNVVILVDESGSMSTGVADEHGSYVTDRLGMAVNMASLLTQGLEKNNVRFALVGFSHKIQVHKDFGQKLDHKKFRDDAYKNRSEYGSCNHDAGAMLKARQLLSKQKTGRNIIISLSDGAPARCGSCELYKEVVESVGSGDSGPQLKREVKRAEKNALVTAVGIDTDEVKRYYDKYFVARTEREFADSLLRILQKEIKRG